MNQLITSESYNKVDFTDEELDNSGFAGLEGKFINENTFIGVQKYHLSSLKSEIPEQFIFQTKIKLIENYGVNAGDISSYKWGTWAFKVPVTVDKNLSKTMLKPISEIVSHVPFGKSKTTDILKSMIKKGAVKVEGRGRGTKYILK